MKPFVVCGIPRSGSTLIWQIVQTLFPLQNIQKTHPSWKHWSPDDSAIIITVRDPRDVAASLYRVRLSRGGENVGGEEGLRHVISRTLNYFESVPYLFDQYHILLKYESFVHNYKIIYDALESFAKIKINEETRKKLSKEFSINANKKRAQKLENFNQVDDSGIHGDHIGSVEHGSWKHLPFWMRSILQEELKNLCEEWEYEKK